MRPLGFYLLAWDVCSLFSNYCDCCHLLVTTNALAQQDHLCNTEDLLQPWLPSRPMKSPMVSVEHRVQRHSTWWFQSVGRSGSQSCTLCSRFFLSYSPDCIGRINLHLRNSYNRGAHIWVLYCNVNTNLSHLSRMGTVTVSCTAACV